MPALVAQGDRAFLQDNAPVMRFAANQYVLAKAHASAFPRILGLRNGLLDAFGGIALTVGEHVFEQVEFIGEVMVQRAFGHARRRDHLVERGTGVPVITEERGRVVDEGALGAGTTLTALAGGAQDASRRRHSTTICARSGTRRQARGQRHVQSAWKRFAVRAY